MLEILPFAGEDLVLQGIETGRDLLEPALGVTEVDLFERRITLLKASLQPVAELIEGSTGLEETGQSRVSSVERLILIHTHSRGRSEQRYLKP